MSNGPLTVSRRFVEKLKPEICCSESRATCREDEFCSSSPSQWPLISMSGAKVRLTYPADKNKPSIPGIPDFCDAYTKWHVKSGCNLLAREIIGSMPEPGKSVLTESLKKRCALLYDDSPTGKALNEDRADDLKNISTFCQNVDSVERRRGHWGTFFKGGGAAGGIALVGLVIWKIIKAIKKIGTGVYETGTGISKFAEGVDLAARGIRRLVTTSIPNFARTMRYVLTFGWLRGKKPPEIKPPIEDKPAVPTQAPPVNPQVAPPSQDIQPHIDVVRTQLSTLAESEHYSGEGNIFARLDRATQIYLAHLAIKRWEAESQDKRAFYIQDDHFLTEGKLPVGFIVKFARDILSEHKIPLLTASAKVWGVREGRPIFESAEHSERQTHQILLVTIAPEIESVRYQLISDMRFAKAASAHQNYLTLKAISKWNSLPDDVKMNFIRDGKIPGGGQLPINFIRAFRKREFSRQKATERRAFVFEQVAAKLLAFDPQLFDIIDARAAGLLRAWNGLTQAVQREFMLLDKTTGAVAGNRYLPASFVEFMHPLLVIGTVSRDASGPSLEPWKYGDSTDEIYQGHSSSDIMKRLVPLSGEISYYPETLRQRAKLIIDLWTLLHRRIRARFAALDRAEEGQSDEVAPAIPFSFISFVYLSIGGFSAAAREAMSIVDDVSASSETGDDKPKKPGGGHGSTGTNSSPSRPPGAAPSSGTSHAAISGAAAHLRNTQEIVVPPEVLALIEQNAETHDPAIIADTSLTADVAATAGTLMGASQMAGASLMQAGAVAALPLIPLIPAPLPLIK